MLLNAPIIDRLPDWRDPARRGSKIPKDIVGSTVVGFGSAPVECDVEGGGLIIDYVPRGSTETKRAIFAFNELGMWPEIS